MTFFESNGKLLDKPIVIKTIMGESILSIPVPAWKVDGMKSLGLFLEEAGLLAEGANAY